jgi:hypothetical protein
MSDKTTTNDSNMSSIFKSAFIRITITVLVIALMSMIALRSEISGKSENFVHRTIAHLTATPDMKGDVLMAAGLAIAQDFSETFEELRWRGAIYELLVHLAIAGIVALVLIYFIEVRVRKFNQEELQEFRQQVRDNVWQAICTRFVPQEVTEQIETILLFDFVKKDVRYEISLDAVPGTIVGHTDTDEWVLLKRELAYSIQNISGKPASYPFSSSLLATADKQLSVTVGNNHHGLSSGQTLTFPRHEFLSIKHNEHKIEGPGDKKLTVNVDLKPGESCEIIHTCCELLRVSDEANYVQSNLVVGLDVTVTNYIPDRVSVTSIYLSHPEAAEHFVAKPMQHNMQRRVFENKAILPGQMFSIQWEKKTA